MITNLKRRWHLPVLCFLFVGSVTAARGGSWSVSSRIGLGTSVVQILADPNRRCIYAIDRGNSDILFVDPITQSVLKKIYVGKDPTGFDIDVTGKVLYVANKGPGSEVPGSYRIAVVDLDTKTEVTSYILPQRAVNVTAGRAGRLYYNSGYDLWNSGDAHVLNTVTGVDIGSFAGVKSRMVISTDKTRLFGQYIYYGNLGQMGVWNAASDSPRLVDTMAYSPYPYGWDYDNYCLSGNDRRLAYGRVLFNATNLLNQIGVFPEQIYALNHDGSVAFGSSAIWDSTTFTVHGDATKLMNLPFSTTVMDFDDPTGTLYAFNSTDKSLYVIAPEMTGIVVTFNAEGGFVSPASNVVTYGQTYGVLPMPTRAGYSFQGWQAATNGVSFAILSNSVVSIHSNHTLNASWAANVYTVTFDPQGGSVTGAIKFVTYNTAYGALPWPFLPAPVRVDYTFDGWFTDVNGAGVQITDTTIVTQASDHTLYAKWSPEPYVCDPADDRPLASAGQFTGYFYNEAPFAGTNIPSVRGLFTLTLSNTNGKFTAKAQLQSSQVSFSAKAWTSQETDGTRGVSLTTKRGERLDLFVRQNRLWGALSSGSLNQETFSLEGSRNRFADFQDAEAQAALETYKGYYTVALPLITAVPTGAALLSPQGSGYLTLTVDRAGKVRLAGKLADGTLFSQSSTLILFDGCGPEACVPFFVPLYSRKGWASGLLWFTPGGKWVVTTDRDLGWFVRWEKPVVEPDGASVLLDVVGGYYSQLPTLVAHYQFTADTNAVPYYYTGGVASLATAALPDSIGVISDGSRLVISSGNRPVFTGFAYDYWAENSALATLLFAPRTGIFSGHFNLYYDYTLNGHLLHRTVSVPYAGVLTPVRGRAFVDEPSGQGFYLVPDNNPLWRFSKIKHSYRIRLDEAP